MAAEEDYELEYEDDDIEDLEAALAMSLAISNEVELSEVENEDDDEIEIKRQPENEIKTTLKTSKSTSISSDQTGTTKISSIKVSVGETERLTIVEHLEKNINELNIILRDKAQLLGLSNEIEETEKEHFENLCASEEEHRMNIKHNFEMLLNKYPKFAQTIMKKHEVLIKSAIHDSNTPESSLSLVALHRMLSASSDAISPLPTQIAPEEHMNHMREMELLMNEIPMTLSTCNPPLGRRNISPDGDCLFQAILYELRRVNPEETRTSAELRKDAWQKIVHLKENGNEEQKCIIKSQIDFYGIENYEKVVTTPGRWADDLGDTLPWIIATLLDMDVHIYDQSKYLDRQRSFVKGGERPILRLIYSGSHYDATTPSSFGGGVHGRRFTVGQRVLGKIGKFHDWQKGTISSVFEYGMCVYHIELDSGETVECPTDSDLQIVKLIDEDHPNLHIKAPIHKFTGKTLEGRWYCGKLGLATFDGVKILLDKKIAIVSRIPSFLGRHIKSVTEVEEVDYKIMNENNLCVGVGGVNAFGMLTQGGNRISFTARNHSDAIGEKWRRLEEKDELVCNTKSLNGVWEFENIPGKRGEIKGNKLFKNKQYLLETYGDDPDPNFIFNWLFLNDDKITILDMATSVEVHGKISSNGKTLYLGTQGEATKMPENTDLNGYVDSVLPTLIELNLTPGHYIATENQIGIEEEDLVYMEKFEEGESEHRGYIGGKWTWVTMVDKNGIYFEKVPEVETGMKAGYYATDKLFTLAFFDNDRSLRAHVLKSDVVYLSEFRFVAEGEIMGKITESNNTSHIGGWVRIHNEYDTTIMSLVENIGMENAENLEAKEQNSSD